jgi:hypothetical protein
MHVCVWVTYLLKHQRPQLVLQQLRVVRNLFCCLAAAAAAAAAQSNNSQRQQNTAPQGHAQSGLRGSNSTVSTQQQQQPKTPQTQQQQQQQQPTSRPGSSCVLCSDGYVRSEEKHM